MSSVDANTSCLICETSNSRLCDRCKNVRYCSKDCQHADWPTHKLLCGEFAKFVTTKRPSKDHFRGILFPVDKKKPEFVWLHAPWEYDEEEDTEPYQYAKTRSYFGPQKFVKSMTIQYNTALKRKLSNTIHLSHNEAFLVDGSSLNKSVASITSTKSHQPHEWCDPLVAYGMIGLGIDQTTCRDLDMNDFRHITDLLLWYGREPEPVIKKPAEEKIKGVRINCLGDVRMFQKPKFEAVEISPTDPIFSDHDVSDITKRIGIPIFTRRCPPNPKWANDVSNKMFQNGREGGSPFNNQDATFLHLCCDPKADFNARTGQMGWGWASMQWQNSVGSTIVVRQDKKPLLPLQAEALCRYCRHDARDLMAHSMGEYAPEKPMKKEAVLAMICRPAFVISWYRLMEEKRKAGEDTSDANAPYPYYDVSFD